MINIDLKRIPARLGISVIHEHVDVFIEDVSQQPLIVAVIRGQEIISAEFNLFVNVCKVGLSRMLRFLTRCPHLGAP